MTSTTNAREWLDAVDEIESTDSQIRCSAVRPPMVRSVMAMSLLRFNRKGKRRQERERADVCSEADSLDGTDETDNVEVSVRGGLEVRDPAC